MGALESSLQNVLWYPPFFSQTKPTSSWWSSNCSSRNGASPLVTKQWGGWRKSPGERNRQTWWVCQYLTSGLSLPRLDTRLPSHRGSVFLQSLLSSLSLGFCLRTPNLLSSPSPETWLYLTADGSSHSSSLETSTGFVKQSTTLKW